jgi:hypothetical protein
MTDENDNKRHLNVVDLTTSRDFETKADLDADMVLEAAIGKLSSVMVVGFTENRGFYMALSEGSIAENLLILETTRLMINEAMLGDADYE